MIDQIGRMKALYKETEISEHHVHPQLTRITPNGWRRRGAITFAAAAANTETVTLGMAGGTSRIYTFKTALGAAPAAGNVTIKVQGTADLTARRFADAINGLADADDILYSAGEGAHPDFLGAYTGIRMGIGAIAHPTGATVQIRESLGDTTGAVTLSDTVSHAAGYLLSPVIRSYATRYVLTGNHANLISRVAGGYQTICPMGTVVNPFETGAPVCAYDVAKVIVEAVDVDSLVIECDGYYSLDEITFTNIWHGLEMSRQDKDKGCQMYMVSCIRIPAGAGFYLKIRSNGTDAASWVDFKVQYHIYPTDLA